jgi:hypothetical protein
MKEKLDLYRHKSSPDLNEQGPDIQLIEYPAPVSFTLLSHQDKTVIIYTLPATSSISSTCWQ